MKLKLTRRGFLDLSMAVGVAAPMGQLSGQAIENQGYPVFLDYDQAQLDAAYNQGVWAPNRDRIRVQRANRNKAALQRLGDPERIAYGLSNIEQLDLYKTNVTGAPIHIYLHGGAWRSGGGFGSTASKAEVFVRAGAHFISPDFIQVREAGGSLFPMVEQVRRSVAWVYRNASAFGGDPARIYLSGHSSGAHLVAAVLMTDWANDFNLPGNLIKGALCSSGIFDLYPVSLSSRREYIAFTDDMVNRLSPIRHLDKLNTPVILTYGTRESPEFQRQSREFFDALMNASKQAQLYVGEELNHYEIADTMDNPYGFLGHIALKQMGI
ncbi:MAG: alpha/beta hydrolase [Gammaproteobacteria bacterium]|nr:alpha/beta hydrolase [Gammaproteobacteria bacterium]